VRSIDEEHTRPEGERACGALYTFHQLIGGADAQLDDVVDGLRTHGFGEQADRISNELIGMNTLAGRWTFQVVEEFDDGYCATFRALAGVVRDETMLGRRHVLEAEVKQRRRTHEGQNHTAVPDENPYGAPVWQRDGAPPRRPDGIGYAHRSRRSIGHLPERERRLGVPAANSVAASRPRSMF